MTSTKPARNDYEPDPRVFLTTVGSGREIAVFQKRQTVFAQDDAAGAVFYILQGKVRHTVVSMFGKEANLDILSEGDFFGILRPGRRAFSCELRNRNHGLQADENRQ